MDTTATVERTQEERTQEERIVSVLAHLSFFFFAVLVPIVLWAVQRGRSAYASFQAFQALVMHLVSILIVFVTIAFAFLGIFGGVLGFAGASATGEPSSIVAGSAWILFGVLVFCALFTLQLVFMVFAVVAAIKTGRGEDFHYPLIGRWAERWWRALESTSPSGELIESARSAAG